MSRMSEVDIAVKELQTSNVVKASVKTEINNYLYGTKRYDILSHEAQQILKDMNFPTHECPNCASYLTEEGEKETVFLCHNCGTICS